MDHFLKYFLFIFIMYVSLIYDNNFKNILRRKQATNVLLKTRQIPEDSEDSFLSDSLE